MHVFETITAAAEWLKSSATGPCFFAYRDSGRTIQRMWLDYGASVWPIKFAGQWR